MSNAASGGGHVAVVGGGYMGGGIARTFAAHGFDCVLVDVDPARAADLVEALRAEAARHAEVGLIDGVERDRVLAHLRPGSSLEDGVADAVYVSEAVPERPALKREVLGKISAAASPDAVIGTNTSTIPIEQLAETVTGPERFLGVHWMNPAPFVPCVEVIPGPQTAPDVVERTFALMQEIGKVPTRVADSPGFVANRLQYALFREAARIVEEGVATPAEIDEVVSNSFGFRLPFFGPFAIADIAGLDVYRDSFGTLEAAYGERLGVPALLVDAVAEGRRGLKSGEGFYDYDADRSERVPAYRDAAYTALLRLRRGLDDAAGGAPS